MPNVQGGPGQPGIETNIPIQTGEPKVEPAGATEGIITPPPAIETPAVNGGPEPDSALAKAQAEIDAAAGGPPQVDALRSKAPDQPVGTTRDFVSDALTGAPEGHTNLEQVISQGDQAVADQPVAEPVPAPEPVSTPLENGAASAASPQTEELPEDQAIAVHGDSAPMEPPAPIAPDQAPAVTKEGLDVSKRDITTEQLVVLSVEELEERIDIQEAVYKSWADKLQEARSLEYLDISEFISLVTRASVENDFLRLLRDTRDLRILMDNKAKQTESGPSGTGGQG